jgi:hypothetical protein
MWRGCATLYLIQLITVMLTLKFRVVVKEEMPDGYTLFHLAPAYGENEGVTGNLILRTNNEELKNYYTQGETYEADIVKV